MSETKRVFLSLAAVGCVSITVLYWALNRPGSSPAGNQAAASTLSRLDQRVLYDPQLTQKNVEFWAARERDDPQGAIGITRLASLYLQRYRETGDITDAVRSEQAARRALRIRSANYSAHEQLARALLTQHRFREALTAADQATDFSPDGNRVRTDILLDLGEDAAAVRALSLIPRQKDDINRISLRARLRERQGRVEEALKLYQEAQRLVDNRLDLPADVVAAAHRKVGLVSYNMGRAADAESEFRQAIAIFPRDYQAMYALARLNAGRGEWKAALEWGEKSAAIVPSPETIALLGDAHAALGNTEAARKQYELVESIGALGKAQGAIYDRQRAMFYADHERNLKEALTLARNEMKLRHDVYAYDTLAWVSYKNGLLPEAQAAIQKALATGARDALLEYHAGVIASASGNDAGAKMHLERALKINPYFYPPSPARARDLLSKLGEVAAVP